MHAIARVAVAAALVACAAASLRTANVIPSKEGTIRMVVAFCPTDFTGEGAIVDVNPLTANWTIKTRFHFPGQILGCVADYSPSYDFDPRDPNTLWFDFTSNAGFFLAVDTRFGNTTTLNSNNLFFTGFIDFKYFARSNTLNGIAGTVTQEGYCSDGCVSWGIQDVANKRYRQIATIPFKEAADDASYVNWDTGVFYFQAGYDLRDTPCAPVQSDECLLAINISTGALINATYTPQYDVYKYGRRQLPDGRVNAFMVGFNEFCTPGETNTTTYAFGQVNMRTAQAVPKACVSQDIVIQTDEWIASYSLDETLVATGSGNGDGDDPQLLVFNATSGSAIVNSQLHGLAKALRGDMGLVFIWALEFVQMTPDL